MVSDLIDQLRADLAPNYELDRELGHGGMATVFLAHDRRHDRQVAIKVLHRDLAAAIGGDRFLREIRIAAGLNHPHIVPLHESGTAGGSLFYVMPYIPGPSLRQRLLQSGRIPLAEALKIGHDVADAIAYAHDFGFIHRDIKPDNILLTGRHAVVTDFGIARAVDAAAPDHLTRTGIAVGTPLYMSPEQAFGQPIDGRSDIYSLGCVIYEMLEGRPPFSAPTPEAVALRRMSEVPPSLSGVEPPLPPAVVHVVDRALARSPADRYQTATDFAEALEAAERGTLTVAAPPGPKRRWWPVAAAAALVLLLIGGIWGTRAPARTRLDARRMVVLPVTARVNDAPGLGEDVTTALLAALNSTRLITGIDGWRMMGTALPDIRRLTPGEADALARDQRAAFYVESQLLAGDSLRLVLELRDVRGDERIVEALSFPRTADAWTIGLSAARMLLPHLLAEGQAYDFPALGSRSPAAAAAYLLGQRALRRAQFGTALAHFQDAVGVDSSFALAAITGAWSASWALRNDEALALARLALRHRSALSPQYTNFVTGLAAFVEDRADTAVHYLNRAIEMDPDWPEAWTALGEVYSHYLPEFGRPDSMQRVSFERARRSDPGFQPVLYHLTELAVRRGDIPEAERMLETLRASGADSIEIVILDLIVRCGRNPDAVHWRAEVGRHTRFVADVGSAVAVAGLPQPRCARAAWSAALAYDTLPGSEARRERALSGMQGMLMAQGRYDELRTLLSESRLPRGVTWRLTVLDALAGAPFATEAAVAADSLLARSRAGGDVTDRWYAGAWAAHQGRVAEARVLAAELETAHPVAARNLRAWIALAGRDTAAALAQLTQGGSTGIFVPWETLNAERVATAELLLARGQYARAAAMAALMDAPGSVMCLMYLPRSLSVRLRAARALGDQRAADEARQRLLALGQRAE